MTAVRQTFKSVIGYDRAGRKDSPTHDCPLSLWFTVYSVAHANLGVSVGPDSLHNSVLLQVPTLKAEVQLHTRNVLLRQLYVGLCNIT